MKVTKLIGLPLCVLWKNNFLHKKLNNQHKLELKLKGKKFENVRHYAREFQILVEKGSCNESAAMINTNFYEFFTQGFSKK